MSDSNIDKSPDKVNLKGVLAMVLFFAVIITVDYLPPYWWRLNNTLERVLVIGQSTKNDFINFKDMGALGAEANYKGFYTSNVSTFYDENKVLAWFEINLMKKWYSYDDASFNAVKKALVNYCGKEWEHIDNSSYSSIASANGNCRVVDNNSDTLDVAVGIPNK